MYKKLSENLKKHNIDFSYFENGEQCVKYLQGQLENEKIAFGGSMTLKEIGLYEALKDSNDVYWHWIKAEQNQREIESQITTYILSANAIAETGEIVNIDGTGNRVANAIYGAEKVYYVCGYNKIESDLHSAIDRARNIASPLNAERLKTETPCRVTKNCMDCQSTARICNVLSIIMGRTGKQVKCEVIVIGEKFGY